MERNVTDYLLDTSGRDWETLLAAWAWRLPPEFSVRLVNRFGDLFLSLPDGSVRMLDVGGGLLERIADSWDDFREGLLDPDTAENFLLIPLVDAAVQAGLHLAPDRCYCFKRPVVLGGEYAPSNVGTISIDEHYAFTGSLHEQLRDLPDGTPIEFEIVNDPPPAEG